MFEEQNIFIDDDEKFEKVLDLVKDRCTLLPDFVEQAAFFFVALKEIDLSSVKPKWSAQKNQFFIELIRVYELLSTWHRDELERTFKEMTAVHQMKPGELLLPLRIMLVGGKYGPGVFDIAAILGKDDTLNRIKYVLEILK